MHKNKVSLICQYKGVIDKKRVLKGIFAFDKNGKKKDDFDNQYFIDFKKDSLILDSTYKIEGFLFLNADCKMAIDIISISELINPITGKSPF